MNPISQAAAALGKLGGSKKSEAKTNANRINAKKPRPNRKNKTQPHARKN